MMRHEALPYDDCRTIMKDARPLVKLEDRHRRRLERWHEQWPAATDKADA
jgi:hypothetical protein